MQQELIEMLDKMVKYFDEIPSDSYYYRETAAILGEAEKLVEKAKNSAKEPAVPQGWRKQRMANWPHSEHGMRLIGFVVPDDGRPLGLISERLEEIIGSVTPATPAAAAPSQPVRGMPDVATWLWFRFVDYCRKQSVAPRHQHGLFAIVHDLRTMLSSTTPPVHAAAQEQVMLTDEEWLEYLLRNAPKDVLSMFAVVGGSIQTQGRWIPLAQGFKALRFIERAIIAALREKERAK